MGFYGILMGFNGIYDGYPLVNVYITMERSTIFQLGKSTISMAMFNSYVTNYQRVAIDLKTQPTLRWIEGSTPCSHGDGSLYGAGSVTICDHQQPSAKEEHAAMPTSPPVLAPEANYWYMGHFHRTSGIVTHPSFQFISRLIQYIRCKL